MRSLLVLVLVLGCTVTAAKPPHADDITAWANLARYKLGEQRDCKQIEVAHFGAKRAVCWSAKSQIERAPPGSRMFPRIEITVADYGTEPAAKARIAKFRHVPQALDGPLGKAYPLRAGFRVGSRIVIVTTDAYAFDPDVVRVAGELAKATGGTELTCWQSC